MRVALVGAGYVADFYAATLGNHPALELVGVTDLDADRARRFAELYKVRAYPSLDALLADPRVQAVVNLTSPASHYAVTRDCLTAGRHVYSEKPLAMSLPDAEALVELAEREGLVLSAAPCNLL